MSAPKRKFKPTQKSFKGQPKIQPTVRTVLGPTNVKVVQNPSETTRTTPDMKSELKQIEYKQRFQGTPSNVSTTIKRRIKFYLSSCGQCYKISGRNFQKS